MCSIRNFILLAFGAAMFIGCQRATNRPPEALNDTPIIEDGAMQARNWPKSHLYYENVGVVAGPTGAAFVTSGKIPPAANAVTEPFLFLGDDIMMPFYLMRVPPWTTMESRGASVPPSYTAVPSLNNP